MNFKKKYILIISTYFFIFYGYLKPSLVFGFQKQDKATPIYIERGVNFYEIGLHLDILEDKEGVLKIEDISSGKFESEFKKNYKKVPNFGLTRSTFWARVTIINKTSRKRDWFLSFNYVTQDYVTYYKRVGKKWISEELGDYKKFSDKIYKIRPFVFEIGEKEKETYYIKVSGSPTQLNLTLLTKKKMLMLEGDDNTKFSLFFGIVASMVLYNTFIFLSTKSLSYFYYVIYVLFYGLFLGVYQGFAQKYIFTENIWVSNNGLGFFAGVTCIFLSLFTISYLNLQKTTKWLLRLFFVVFALSIVLIISSFTAPYATTLKLLLLNGLILSALCYFAGFYKLIKGYRPARYFILAFSFMLIGGVLTNLAVANVIPSYPIFNLTIIIGNALQLIFLSMGLADRFNLIQEEAQKLQENYAKELEKEVTKKTKQVVLEKDRAESSEKEVSGLLHNMKQAVFSIDVNGIIVPPVSVYSLELFGKEVDGVSVYDTLYKDLDRKGESFQQAEFVIAASVGEDFLQYNAIDYALPSHVHMRDNKDEEKSLKINYSPILSKDEQVLKIMLVVEDVTEIENLEKEARETQAAGEIKIKRLQEIVSNDKKGIRIFSREVRLNLSTAKKSIDSQDLSALFRAVHTIKGNARIHNLMTLSSEIHVLENDLNEKRKDPSNIPEKDYFEKVYKELKSFSNNYIELSKEIFGQDVDETVLAGNSDEIIVSKSLFIQGIEKLKEISKETNNDSILYILKTMENEEFKKYLGSLHKAIQKMGLSLDKDIELKIEGEEVYLNVKTASMMKDSLMHIIQNAADHGIEKEGVITITIKNEDKFVHINVEDNGKGIDPEVIYQKSLEKEMISKEDSEDFTKQEKLNLIMLPGLSTKTQATEYSGRGVGMDVVNANIKSLGGKIELNSIIGKGTIFKIIIPQIS